MMDYLSGEKERARQAKFAEMRTDAMRPFLDALTRLGVRPNGVTWLGVLFLIGGAVMPPEYPGVATVLLLLYVVCDGIDGPLARVQDRSHNGGAIVDMYADQLGVVLLPMAAIYHIGANGVLATGFSTGYVLFIILVVYQNGLNIFDRRFIRVKYLMFILYAISLAVQSPLVLNYFFLVFAIYYWMESHFSIVRIYDHFDGKR